tara:strand:+ start:4172 stop:4564 length:393 start_codon:yes stop_codon:yes gene_type:complete
MSDITLITPPDHIFSDAYNFFLIYPSENIKQQFNSIIADKQDHFNVYLYEPDSENQDPKWLLSTINIADTIILDVDNSLPQIGDILAYIIAKPQTYWLTKGENMYYNMLSNKRVYNLDFITTGGNFEKKQ